MHLQPSSSTSDPESIRDDARGLFATPQGFSQYKERRVAAGSSDTQKYHALCWLKAREGASTDDTC